MMAPNYFNRTEESSKMFTKVMLANQEPRRFDDASLVITQDGSLNIFSDESGRVIASYRRKEWKYAEVFNNA